MEFEKFNEIWLKENFKIPYQKQKQEFLKGVDVEYKNTPDFTFLTKDEDIFKNIFDVSKINDGKSIYSFTQGDAMYILAHGKPSGEMSVILNGKKTAITNKQLGEILQAGELIPKDVKNIYTISCYGGLQQPFVLDNGIKIESIHNSDKQVWNPKTGSNGVKAISFVTDKDSGLTDSAKESLEKNHKRTLKENFTQEQFDIAHNTLKTNKAKQIFNDKIRKWDIIKSFSLPDVHTKIDYIRALNGNDTALLDLYNFTTEEKEFLISNGYYEKTDDSGYYRPTDKYKKEFYDSDFIDEGYKSFIENISEEEGEFVIKETAQEKIDEIVKENIPAKPIKNEKLRKFKKSRGPKQNKKDNINIKEKIEIQQEEPEKIVKEVIESQKETTKPKTEKEIKIEKDPFEGIAIDSEGNITGASRIDFDNLTPEQQKRWEEIVNRADEVRKNNNSTPNTSDIYSDVPEYKEPTTSKKINKQINSETVSTTKINTEIPKKKITEASSNAIKNGTKDINWGKIGKVGLIAAAVGAAAYVIGKDDGDKQNQQYQAPQQDNYYAQQIAKDISNYRYGKHMTGFVNY